VCLARGILKKNKITPLVGDYAQITITDKEKKEGVIEEILARKNEIKRPKMANLTNLILVISMNMPSPDLKLLDKQLVFANHLKIKPIIVLNKIDLEQNEKIEEIANIYEKIGYKVIKTNSKENKNIDEVKENLTQGITAFAGNSGVGKSTLLNAIFKKTLAIEGEISTKNKKGKNTTTNVTLYKYNENIYIADTPGFSTFEINEISKEELSTHFPEFINFLNECEFLGCSHIKENKCKVKEAVENGQIDKIRYENYIKIYQELKEAEERKW